MEEAVCGKLGERSIMEEAVRGKLGERSIIEAAVRGKLSELAKSELVYAGALLRVFAISLESLGLGTDIIITMLRLKILCYDLKLQIV
jgi:hypothetical protein